MTSTPIADTVAPPVLRKGLTRMVPRAHRFLAEVLYPGDLAVDLTAGAGRDTLFLYRCVGPQGRVLAFDIQAEALERTGARLADAGAKPYLLSRETPVDLCRPGVYLIHASHAELERYLGPSPRGVIANLGYLPGGKKEVKTDPEATLAALRVAGDRLASEGRIAVVPYVGHPGGAEEGQRVERFFAELPADEWEALTVKVSNRPEAPFLLAAEKR